MTSNSNCFVAPHEHNKYNQYNSGSVHVRIISVDFGGTYTKLGLVENGVLLTTGTIDSQSDGRLTHSLQRVVEKIKELFSYVQWQWGEADGAMFALPCFISQDFLSVTKTFGKFNDAPDIDFRAWAKRELRVPLLLENDARAAILGEWSMGAGQGSQNVVMVTLGTGIGTAVISSGQLFRGAHGLGCALGGHTVTHLSGEKCSCGIQGCMEHHVSSWSLPERAKAHPLWQESELSKASHIDYRTVFEMAEQGDDLATILRTKALYGWGALVINRRLCLV